MIQSENPLLLVDPDQNLLQAYRILFEQVGLPVEAVASLEEARANLVAERLCSGYGGIIYAWLEELSFWKEIKARHPETYLILLTDAPIDEEGYERIFNCRSR